MSTIRPLAAGAILVAAGLIGASGVAYAATGHALILGHKNYAGSVTTVHRDTKGPALRLEAQAGSAPLAVNRSVKVANLNADLLDGKHASQLQTHANRYVIPHVGTASSAFTFNLTGVTPGFYQASYNILASMNTAGDTIACDLQIGSSFQMLNYGSSFVGYSAVSASGTLDLRHVSAAHPVQLYCFSTDSASTGSGAFDFTDQGANNHSVTLIRIDGVTAHTSITPAAVSAHTQDSPRATG